MAQEEEKKKVLFAFDVYGDGNSIDAAYAVDALRSLNLNPSQELVLSLGVPVNKGEKILSFDEFWNLYQGVKADSSMGGFTDFVECLKIYDVAENGTMKLGDLTHMLLSLGERLDQSQVDEVMNDCMLEEADDEDWIPYLPFLCRLCDKPIPKDLKPK